MVTEIGGGGDLQTDIYHISAYDKHRSMLSVSEITFQCDGIQLYYFQRLTCSTTIN